VVDPLVRFDAVAEAGVHDRGEVVQDGAQELGSALWLTRWDHGCAARRRRPLPGGGGVLLREALGEEQLVDEGVPEEGVTPVSRTYAPTVPPTSSGGGRRVRQDVYNVG